MDQPNGPNGLNASALLAMQIAAAKAAAEAELISQPLNENAAKYLGGVVGFLMLFFMLSHWTRVLAHQSSKGPRKLEVLASCSRAFRKVMIRQVPGFSTITVGHATTIFSYIAALAAITFTNIDWSSTTNSLGKRFGWMAITNIAIITFLAMKNTPLAFLTGYSYERINILHKVGGFTTVVLAMLHMIMQLHYFSDVQALTIILEPAIVNANVTAGITAAVAFLVILVSALLVKKFHYEVFYITHVSMYIAILVAIGLHRPDITTKTLVIVIVAGSIFFADRFIRAGKLLWYSLNNNAAVYPLGDSTRVVLRRSPMGAIPGSHCFLWIPKIRAFQTHPFTITSVDSLELVISARDGFTKDLHQFALKNPGKSIKASIDGPYGTSPNFESFDKVILIAGGSGASFTFGLAVDLVKKLGSSRARMIEFIWTIRNQEHLSCFSEQLDILQKSPLVNLNIHSTRSLPSDSESSLLTPPEANLTNVVSSESEKSDNDVEKQGQVKVAGSIRSFNILPGRPDIPNLIMDVVGKADKYDRIAIAACGPASMISTTRNTAADCISVSGPSVVFYSEQFGW